MLNQLNLQLRKKIRDLKVTDSKRASEVSRKADDVASVANQCIELRDRLSSKVDDQISEATIFLCQYVLANPNVRVADVAYALRNNGYHTDWIMLNPDMIVDPQTIASLIICSEKQGMQNAKTL